MDELRSTRRLSRTCPERQVRLVDILETLIGAVQPGNGPRFALESGTTLMMTMLLTIRTMLVIALAALVSCAIATVDNGARGLSAQSRFVRLGTPTGREPRLVWTPERQAIWSQMRADFDANPGSPRTLGGQYYKLIKENAECACKYGDTGLWATLMFQITGDRRYADIAFRAIEKSFFKVTGRSLGGNFAREYSAEYVLQYDWLYPALSSAQRSTYLSKLNDMFSVATTNPSNVNAPVRTNDSDQTVGVYFGLAFLYVATADHNAPARDYFNRQFVGGLTPTGRDRSTLRNAILDYVTMAAGGEWIEGSQYNLGTVRLLLLGAEGVRTATRTDHFPEVTQWVSSAALRPLYVITPDLKQSYQWGDNEHPGDFLGQSYSWQTTNGVLAGLTDTDTSPYIQHLIVRLAQLYGATGNRVSEPWARMFLTFDPYMAPARSIDLPLGWFAEGQGLLTYRTGWDDQASMFGAHVPTQQTYVDHQVSYFGDFQLYRRGAWAITHPMSYGGPPVLGAGANTMLHAGFAAMTEFRDVVAMQHDPQGRFAYIAGTTGGQKYASNYYAPPPTYLHEWTRSLLYLPGAQRSSDTIVVFDRSHAENPRDLANLQRYSAADRQIISQSRSLREWILHVPVRPTISANTVSWDLGSGERARVTILLPRQQSVTGIDESELWAKNTPVRVEQRKWQIRIMPESEQTWTTFLNVIDVAGAGMTSSAQLVTSSSDDVQGTLIRHQGQSDVVAVFNAAQGPTLQASPGAGGYSNPAQLKLLHDARLRRSGFTIQWPSASQVTDVYVADLDPARSWQYRVNSGPARSVTLQDGGIARLTVTGAGSQTLVVF
jgi:hypothetical protein